ncbi:hypothetical protein RD110_01430 [Rhodoferax koreense]|uniref:Uncharacterized protein n=1 Tax=Rhodoferax koreensis TaxID=1842727 RepID=A0A1P8JQL1_9BURK|nr:tetratricopeptide repeat protein [Rhodoferax koreense]APW36030.1 hypothetical protein RD110_01430 [Rhodoferax koreense]
MRKPLFSSRWLTALALVVWGMSAWAASPAWSAEPSADTRDDARRVFDRVAPSVVTVQVQDGHGSGVVVAPGKVATNCHVVRDEPVIRVVTATGEFKAAWTAQLPDVDLCLLSVPELKAAPVALRRSDSLAVGEPVHAVGNPLGFGLAVSSGLLTIVQKGEPYALLVATAPQSPGSSGGGLFDREGRLLGLTTAVLGTGQNLNKIVVADGVADLLAHGAAPPPAVVPPEAERHRADLAEELQASSSWDKLERHALAWTAVQPTAALAWVYLGQAQQTSGRKQEAEASFRRALALDDHLPFAWLTLGDVLYDLNRPDEAEQALAKAESLWPGYPEPARTRARILLAAKQPEAALAQIRESLRKMPERTYAWEQLGAIQEALGHRAEAIAAYTNALRLGSTEAFTKVRLAALAAEDGNASPAFRAGLLKGATAAEEAKMLVALADADHKAGRYAQAEEASRKAVALAPDSARAWNALGGVLVATQRLDAAEDAFGKAIALEPAEPAWLTNRADVRRTRKKTDLAFADVRAALALAPNDVWALRTYGILLLEARAYADADAAFARAHAIEALPPEYVIYWADARQGRNDADGALKMLREVEKTEPVPRALNLVMARVLGRKGDFQGALVYTERAVSADPTESVAWSSKGYALLKLNRLGEAAEALETAVRLDPQLANGWINLGEAQMRALKLGRAIEALEKALSLVPSASDARMFLVQSYMAARLPVKARQQAEKLLEQQPGHLPALGLITMAYLMEGNNAAATETFLKLRSTAPPTARYVRERAIAAGLPQASSLPE